MYTRRSSSSSDRSSGPESSSPGQYSPSGYHMIKVYILQAKLDATAVAELYTLIESCKDVPDGLRLQLCGNPSDADVILSNVHMRKRLERHLDWDIAVEPIATPFPVSEAYGTITIAWKVSTGLRLAYPRVITQADLDTEVVHLPYLGEKIRSKINEFIRFGRIEECNTIRSSARFLSLKAFASIHGVGSTTARHLYSIGLRTVEDMEQYYDVPIADDGVPLLPNNEPKYTPNGKRIPTNDTIPDLDIKAALVLRHEFAISISRSEVEEMHNLIMAELNDLKPGCASTIVGGYRRGKPESNDVDIVITHADLRGGGEKITGLRKRFVERLYNRGMSRVSDRLASSVDVLWTGLVSHVARE
ncbi:hypothetical protein C0989_012130 [Termitomyces sp. Mn162]|nr:hypothetical protein C0989_012130 [Termitomyces sp. Mn162]